LNVDVETVAGLETAPFKKNSKCSGRLSMPNWSATKPSGGWGASLGPSSGSFYCYRPPHNAYLVERGTSDLIWAFQTSDLDPPLMADVCVCVCSM